MSGPWKLGECREIDDGRKDIMIRVNGQTALIVPQEFIESSGVNYEDAKAAVTAFGALLVGALNEMAAKKN